MARFERSTLPEHRDTRTVVLRFLKVITPVKCIIPLYDGYIPCPREGELYQRFRPKTLQNLKVWSVNIDESKKSHSSIRKGIQLLWDA